MHKEVHVCRIQEFYLWHPICVTTLLGELSKRLEEMGYQRNKYDWWVMNKTIDNKKCTILWNIDDLKTSYVDPDVIYSVLADIDAEYGNIAKMTITRGKVHKYLGTTIDYSSPGKLILSMIDYIGNIIDDIT